MTSASRVFKKAILSSAAGKVSLYLVQILFLMVYARLFSPEEFGVLASIQVFLVFFQMIALAGLGPAIIHEKEITNCIRNSIFSVTLAIAIVASFGFYLLSFYLDDFYGSGGYGSVAPVLALSVFVQALTTLPLASLQKDLKFLNIAIVDVFSEVCAFFMVFILYINELSVVALASRYFVIAIVKYVLLRALSARTSIGMAAFSSNLKKAKVIFNVSVYQLLFNIVNYFSRNLDNILIAKYFNVHALGIYEKSYQLMRYPSFLLTSSLSPAVQPALTRQASEGRVVVDIHNIFSSNMLLAGVLVAVFLFVSAPSLVFLMFGPQWLEVAKLIQILSISIPFQVLLSSAGGFFQSMGAGKLLFVSGCVSAIFNVCAIFIGLYLGEIHYIATCLVVSFIINFFQAYFVLYKYVFKVDFREFVLSMLPMFIVFLAVFPFVCFLVGSQYARFPEGYPSAIFNALVCFLLVGTPSLLLIVKFQLFKRFSSA